MSAYCTTAMALWLVATKLSGSEVNSEAVAVVVAGGAVVDPPEVAADAVSADACEDLLTAPWAPSPFWR